MTTHTIHTAPSTLPVAEPVLAGAANPTRQLRDVAGGAGAVLLAASSVAWIAGDSAAELRAILMTWAFPLIGLGITGLASRLEARAPTARAVVTALAAIGAAAGTGFAIEAAMVEHFGVDRLMREATPSAPLALGLPGLCMPLALLALGVLSGRLRALPRRQAALLALAGVLFPMSRMPSIPALALVADVVLLGALAPVALTALRRRRRRLGA